MMDAEYSTLCRGGEDREGLFIGLKRRENGAADRSTGLCPCRPMGEIVSK